MQDIITPEKRQRVIDLLKEYNGNYNEVFKKTLLKVSQIKEIDIEVNKKFNYTKEGLGRPELQRYIIGIKRKNEIYWNGDEEPNREILQARQDYDDGKVEICQARDGLNFILYAIPRKTIDTNRKPYFTAIEEEEDGEE